MRRHIQRALTGAVLGAGLIAIPAYAATYTVTNTNDSGAGSLRQAILDANANPGEDTVEIDPALNGSTFTINSPLPAVASDTQEEIYHNVNIPSAFQGKDESYTNLDDHSSITGDVVLNDDAQLYLDNGSSNIGNVIVNHSAYLDLDHGNSSSNDDSYVIGNVTLNDSATLDMDDEGAYIIGDVTLNDDSEAKLDEGNYIDGAVTLNHDSEMELGDDSYITGAVTLNDDSEMKLKNESYIAGAVIMNDDSYMKLRHGAYIDNAVTLNDESEMRLVDESRITGAVIMNDDSYMSLDSVSYITGAVALNDYSEMEVDRSSYIEGAVTLNDDSNMGVYGFSSIEGAVTLNDDSEMSLEYYASIDNSVTLNDDSYLELYNASSIGGAVTLHDDSEMDVMSGSSITGAVTLHDDSEMYVVFESSITGAVTLNDNSRLGVLFDSFITGAVTVNDRSQMELVDGSFIEGDVTVNNTAELYIDYDHMYTSSVEGSVTLNDYSVLRNSGANELNTVSGTTTFGSNATFAPDIIHLPLVVDHLNLNNSTLQPWYSHSQPLEMAGTLQIGAAYPMRVLEYGSHIGSFDPAVRSPLHFGITDTNPGGVGAGEIQVYLIDNNINFNRLPGSENARSLGTYLSDYANSTQNQTPGADLDITTLSPGDMNFVDLIDYTSYAGNLHMFDEDMPDNYSAHNTQAYWNQKAFVDSIRANLQNARDSASSPASSFALNQTSGIGQAPAPLSSLRQAMAAKVNALNYSGASSNSSNVWATYNGSRQRIDADSGVGSHDWTSTTNGYTVGYTSGGDRFQWGVAAGHQDSDLNVDALGARGTQRGYNAGIFGALTSKRSYLNGVLGYGKYDNETFGGWDDTEFKNKTLSASLEIGKHLSGDKKSGFTPYASVLWTRIKQDDAVIAPGPFGDILYGGSNSFFTTELGMRYNRRMVDESGSLKGGWQAGLAWLHQGGDTGLPANIGFTEFAGSFPVKSTPLDGNSLRVQLGAYGRIHNRLIGFAGYQGTFGRNQKINAVNAGVGYQF